MGGARGVAIWVLPDGFAHRHLLVGGLGRSGEGMLTMENRWIAGPFSGTRTCLGNRARGLAVVVSAAALAVALMGAAPGERALAQQNVGGQINIGGSIADTVAGSVSGIATSSSASGGVQSTHNEMELGEQEGLAISDASGGNRNASQTNK
jgi:hypothetical protein